MRKTIALLLVAGSLTGCVSWPSDTHPPIPSAMPASQHGLPPGPITADQIEPANAHRIADAIWDEMDQEQTKDQLPATNKDGKKR
jgi:hypothetical protein